MIVFTSFCGAGYLIQSSYSAWQASPVATSITTHPIADLDFPTVTVCPPKGTHSALNYDVMRADNNSLKKSDREKLKKEIYNLFIEPSHMDNAVSMVAVANSENMQQTFQGFQSFPRPDGDHKGFKVKMWNNKGTWHTPWFGKEYNKIHFEDDKFYSAVLDFPEDLHDPTGSGSLVIQLDVDTREEEGWQEEV